MKVRQMREKEKERRKKEKREGEGERESERNSEKVRGREREQDDRQRRRTLKCIETPVHARAIQLHLIIEKILRNGTIQGTDLVPAQTASAAQLSPLRKSTQKFNFIEINT